MIVLPHRRKAFQPTGGGGSGTPAWTDSAGSSIQNNYSGWLGCSFTTTDSITINSVGRWIVSGNTGTHEVAIFDMSGTPVKLASANVNTTEHAAESYGYENLASPLALSAATQYKIVSAETSGGDQWYNVTTINNEAAGITVDRSVYGTPLPYNEDTLNNCYVPVNFLFE